jgi:hypothetical protein
VKLCISAVFCFVRRQHVSNLQVIRAAQVQFQYLHLYPSPE